MTDRRRFTARELFLACLVVGLAGMWRGVLLGAEAAGEPESTFAQTINGT